MLNKLLLQSFCCCCSLKGGCIFIGALQWVYTIYISCRYYDLQKPGCRELKLSCNQTYYNMISFVVSSSTVFGILKNNRACLIPWLIVKFIEFAVFSGFIYYEFRGMFVVPTFEILIPLAFVVFSEFSFWYSWLCIFSFYFVMEHSEKSNEETITQV